MTTPAIRGYVRDPASGAGIVDVTVAVKKHNGGSTVASDTTDSAGLYELNRDTVGYPGPTFQTFTKDSTTDVTSGNVVGQIAGLIWGADIPDVFALLGIGVATGLAVSATGVGMAPAVSAGMALLKDGFPYILEAASSVTLAASNPTNPRIDRIVLRLTREGQTDQGKILLTKIDGTPAASPVAPALTQTSATWDFSLAQVLVGAGVTTIAADKVTDERTILTSATELGYLVGVTSNIQTQLNNKQPLDADLTTIAATITAAGHALLDDANAAAQRTTLGLGNVDNTSDASKPISTLTQTALDAKQPLDSDLTAFAAKTAPSGAVVGTSDSQTLTNKTLTSPAITTPTGIVKGDVGLGNVDNTSDATKNAASVTLTNKTLTTPTITSPTITGAGAITANTLAATSAATGLSVLHSATIGTDLADTFTVAASSVLAALTVNGMFNLSKFLVFAVDSQALADTTSSADTVNYVTAIDTDIVLPTGTWTLYAVGGVAIMHSVAGSSGGMLIDIGGTDGTAIAGGLGASASDRQHFTNVSSKASVGSGTVTVAVQYKPNAAGTVSAVAPWLVIVGVRTA